MVRLAPIMMVVLSRKFYLITISIITVLSIIAYILFSRKNPFYVLGALFHLVGTFALVFLWLVISPKIDITATLSQENIIYYLAIVSPSGNYELDLFECDGEECNIYELIQTGDTLIVDAKIHDVSEDNVLLINIHTQFQVIECRGRYPITVVV